MPLSNTGVDRYLAQNYYSKSQLNSGQLDSRYFAESEHLNSSAGAGDAGKPIKLDAGGHIDASMINDADVDHGSIGGLTDDDHSQYALLAGRSGGQTLKGSTASGENLTLQSTNHATKGKIVFGSASAYDEVNDRFGIGLTNPSYRFDALVGAGAQSIFRAGQSGVSNGFTISSDGSILSFTMVTGKLTLSATTTSYASLNLPNGTAPSSPAAGDIWYDGVLKFRDGSATRTVATVDGSQTLTNKTLTAPVISTISNTGTITLPTATTTLVGRDTTDTLTNKTLTTPLIATLYGGTGAGDDITIHGTSNATRTGSYVILQPTGGNVVVGGSTTDYNFEIQDQGRSNYRFTFNLNDTSENVLGSINNAVGGTTQAQLRIYASRIRLNGTPNIMTTVTPTGTADATGSTGDYGYDSSYWYVKTAGGWKRAALSTW